MIYPFECPNCGEKQPIEMKMAEYKADGHMCPKCGTEMKREVDSMVAHSIDKTGGFYRRFN